MKLSRDQKAAALAARSGSKLVRVGDSWALVWWVPGGSRETKWRGQVIERVTEGRIEWRDVEQYASVRSELLARLAEVAR